MAQRALRLASTKLGHAWVPFVTGALGAIASAVEAARTTATATATHPDWPWVLVAALIGGVGVYAVTWAVLFGWHLWSYRHNGHVDDLWEMKGSIAGNGVQFYLQNRPNVPASTFHDFGFMECIIVGSDGMVRTIPDRDVHPRSANQLVVWVEGIGPGNYEVRWYASEGVKRPRYYEITRGHFTFAAASMWLGMIDPDALPSPRRDSRLNLSNVDPR